MKRFQSLLLLILLVLFGSSACELFKVYDIRGAWDMTLVADGETTEIIIVFSGAKDTGTLSFSFDGDQYTGTYTVQSKKVTISIIGEDGTTLLEGDFTSVDDMSGTLTGTDDITGTWTAERR